MNMDRQIGAILSGVSPNDYLYTEPEKTKKQQFLEDLESIINKAAEFLYRRLHSGRDITHVGVDVSSNSIIIYFPMGSMDYYTAMLFWEEQQLYHKVQNGSIKQKVYFKFMDRVRVDYTLTYNLGASYGNTVNMTPNYETKLGSHWDSTRIFKKLAHYLLTAFPNG